MSRYLRIPATASSSGGRNWPTPRGALVANAVAVSMTLMVTVAAPAVAAGDSNLAPAIRSEVRGVVLELLTTDVVLTVAGEESPFFSLRSFEAERFRQEIAKAAMQEESKGCVRNVAAVPLAWTGTMLSLHEVVQTTCPREAHPAGESRFVTFAVAPGTDGRPAVRPVAMTEWMDATAAFHSLRKDPLVRKALAGAGTPPRGLDELVAAAAASPPVVRAGKDCYAFPDDLLERFAPSHLEGGKVALRISLPGAAVCRNRLTEIGIVVPLPRSLAPGLSAAAKGRAGFLKRNAPREFANHPARIELQP